MNVELDVEKKLQAVIAKDRVRIRETPPMSAHKRWTVTEVLIKGMKS